MLLVTLFALWVDAQVPRLGHDDFATREAATELLDNPLVALVLPTYSDDAEVNYRLRQLRTRNLKWLSAVRLERVVLRADRREWVRLYLVAGRSAIADEYDTFAALHEDAGAASDLFRAWPVTPGEHTGFLHGAVCPGEYERYLAHLDYHRGRAPAPRELDSEPER